jgi:two-component system nitrogen regulation response regulator NtrX
VRTRSTAPTTFIEKPLSIDKVLLTIQHALEQSRLQRGNRALRAQTLRAHEIIGESPEIVDLVKQIDVAAPSNGWVLITGENGTGKELVARADPRAQPARRRAVRGGELRGDPRGADRSELFGHEKGAFTGAVAQKVGKFSLAHGGTIFLDEVADMSVMTQAKVLAHPPGAALLARRRHRDARRRRARDRGDQQGPRARDRAGARSARISTTGST